MLPQSNNVSGGGSFLPANSSQQSPQVINLGTPSASSSNNSAMGSPHHYHHPSGLMATIVHPTQQQQQPHQQMNTTMMTVGGGGGAPPSSTTIETSSLSGSSTDLTTGMMPQPVTLAHTSVGSTGFAPSSAVGSIGGGAFPPPPIAISGSGGGVSVASPNHQLSSVSGSGGGVGSLTISIPSTPQSGPPSGGLHLPISNPMVTTSTPQTTLPQHQPQQVVLQSGVAPGQSVAGGIGNSGGGQQVPQFVVFSNPGGQQPPSIVFQQTTTPTHSSGVSSTVATPTHQQLSIQTTPPTTTPVTTPQHSQLHTLPQQAGALQQPQPLPEHNFFSPAPLHFVTQQQQQQQVQQYTNNITQQHQQSTTAATALVQVPSQTQHFGATVTGGSSPSGAAAAPQIAHIPSSLLSNISLVSPHSQQQQQAHQLPQQVHSAPENPSGGGATTHLPPAPPLPVSAPGDSEAPTPHMVELPSLLHYGPLNGKVQCILRPQYQSVYGDLIEELRKTAAFSKKQLSRLFLGQIPYAARADEIGQICTAASGLPVVFVELITKRSGPSPPEEGEASSARRGGHELVPTGSAHGYCRPEHAQAIMDTLHKKVLIDQGGIWVARSANEIASLNNYINKLKHDHSVKFPGMPVESMVAQGARTLYRGKR